MDTTTKIYGGLGGVVAVFTIIGGLWLTSQTFATDIELASVAQAATAETEQVWEKHSLDKVSAAEARKNDRVERVDRDIRKLKRAIEFGPDTEKLYNESELKELETLRQNILEGHR